MAKNARPGELLRARLHQIENTPNTGLTFDQVQMLNMERSQILGMLAIIEAIWKARY